MSRKGLFLMIAMLMALQLSALRFAKWDTSMGSFTAELYDQLVPITANNFVTLANNGFYDGLIFHRVVRGFVIQDGCPNGTGTGGPGYTIPDEFHPDLNHNEAGILAMARTSAPNSAGSQYYFTLSPQPHLNGSYAVFGKVIENLDVVLDIGEVPVGPNNRPITPVQIFSVQIIDLAIANLFPETNEPVHCLTDEELIFVIEASSEDSIISYTWKLDGTTVQGANDFIFTGGFSAGAHELSCELAVPGFSYILRWQIVAEGSYSEDNIAPELPAVNILPNPFKGTVKISSSAKEVRIYDIRGRLLNRIPAHKGEAIWDGRDTLGNQCPAGIYFIQAGSAIRKALKF